MLSTETGWFPWERQLILQPRMCLRATAEPRDHGCRGWFSLELMSWDPNAHSDVTLTTRLSLRRGGAGIETMLTISLHPCRGCLCGF